MRTLSFLQLVDYFMALCVRQRHLVQQAIGTDMNTGKQAPVFLLYWVVFVFHWVVLVFVDSVPAMGWDRSSQLRMSTHAQLFPCGGNLLLCTVE